MLEERWWRFLAGGKKSCRGAPCSRAGLLCGRNVFADGMFLTGGRQGSPARKQGDKWADYFADPGGRGSDSLDELWQTRMLFFILIYMAASLLLRARAAGLER